MNLLPRMLALVTDAFGGRGGIAQYNRDFLEAVAESGTVSSIIVVPRLVRDIPAPPKIITQTKARHGRIAYSLVALWMALSLRFELVFCGHLFMAPLAASIARLKGAKLIVQTHGIEAWVRPTWLQRSALEGADLVLCVSRHTRAVVLSWAAIAPERVLVVPDTVRDVFTPGDGSKQRVALALQHKVVLLTVGRIDRHERYKGHDRVISAISGLVARGYDVCYLIVGEGTDRGRLDALAQDSGIHDRVRFLGALSLNDLVEIYRVADLFVMPSTGEGFGVVFLEAMASGIPALGLDIAGARDALADGKLGTAVPETDFAVTIADLLAKTRPNPGVLAAATRGRFGRQQFAIGVRAALNRLTEAT